jgi:hypothetical protein
MNLVDDDIDFGDSWLLLWILDWTFEALVSSVLQSRIGWIINRCVGLTLLNAAKDGRSLVL